MDKIFAQIIRKGSKTFYTASLFFPKDIREDVFILYSFVRTVDDLIDSNPPQFERYLYYKDQFYKSYRGKKSAVFIVEKFVDLCRRKKIELGMVEAFFRSQEIDFKKNFYQSFAELEDFIFGVAEVIGLFMARIFSLPNKADQTARLLGKGMQIINILRDIPEDLKRGKIYLPLDEVKRFNADFSKGLNKVNDNDFTNLIRFQIERFYKIFSTARLGFIYIPIQYLTPVSASADIYQYIANKFYQNPLLIKKTKYRPPIFVILYYLLKNKFKR